MKINGKPDGGGGREPIVESLSVTQNGIYTPEPGVDGFDNVDVNVPAPEFVTETLSVSVNNTYYPGQGVDGFSQVIVDVPQSVTGYTEKNITEGTACVQNLNNSASFVASNAFQNNRCLSTVYLPNASQVYDNAFAGCWNLSQVSLPDCERIGSHAFDTCSNLSQVYLPVCSRMESNALSGCKIETVDFPSCTYLGSGTFQRCYSLQTVSLPLCRTLTSWCFDGCSNLSQVYLPNCLTMSGHNFQNCKNLTSIDIPNCTYIGESEFALTGLSQVNFPNLLTVTNSAFKRCSSLTYVNLPNCRSMGGLVFDLCSVITEVHLPNCYYISGAFCPNSTLTLVDMGCVLSTSNWFGNPILFSATNVSQLYIDTNVYGFMSYNSVFSANTPTSLQSGIGSIYTHWQNYDSYINAPGWSSLSSLFVSVGDPDKPMLSFSDGTVNGYTKYIQSNYYSSLNISKNDVIHIDLPEILEVSNYFKAYPNLQTMNLNVPYLNTWGAFANCFSLQTVSLPACKEIGKNGQNDVFQNCTSLSQIYLPVCEYIGPYAFTGCTSLSVISLPACKYIGNFAFQNFTFNTIYLPGSEMCSIDIQTFANTAISSGSIYVPASLVDAYKSAQYWSVYSNRIFPIE